MKKLMTTAAVLVALIAPAQALYGPKGDAQMACVVGWAAVAIGDGAKTAEAAEAAGWRHCRHLNWSVPKNAGKQKREALEEAGSDMAFAIKDTVEAMFKGLRQTAR